MTIEPEEQGKHEGKIGKKNQKRGHEMELHLRSYRLPKWHDASVTQGLPCSPMAH